MEQRPRRETQHNSKATRRYSTVQFCEIHRQCNAKSSLTTSETSAALITQSRRPHSEHHCIAFQWLHRQSEMWASSIRSSSWRRHRTVGSYGTSPLQHTSSCRAQSSSRTPYGEPSHPHHVQPRHGDRFAACVKRNCSLRKEPATDPSIATGTERGSLLMHAWDGSRSIFPETFAQSDRFKSWCRPNFVSFIVCAAPGPTANSACVGSFYTLLRLLLDSHPKQLEVDRAEIQASEVHAETRRQNQDHCLQHRQWCISIAVTVLEGCTMAASAGEGQWLLGGVT